MSLQPPTAERISQVWVDPITADRFEWDGEEWVNLGSNVSWWTAAHGPKVTYAASVDEYRQALADLVRHTEALLGPSVPSWRKAYELLHRRAATGEDAK